MEKMRSQLKNEKFTTFVSFIQIFYDPGIRLIQKQNEFLK